MTIDTTNQTSDATQLTQSQATSLAGFINTIRPSWDPRGIVTALKDARARGTAAEVAVAAIRAAAEPTNRTPAVIALEGPHWQQPTTPGRVGLGAFVQVTERQSCCGGLHAPDSPCDPRADQRSNGRGANAARAALRRTP